MPVTDHPTHPSTRIGAGNRYACQSYTHGKPCRYDKRPDDRQCDGCPRSSDLEYLEGQGVDVAKFGEAKIRISLLVSPHYVRPVQYMVAPC